MLHVKKGDYAHWAVRINKASRKITHISAGPVIKARDYRNEVIYHLRRLGAAAHTQQTHMHDAVWLFDL